MSVVPWSAVRLFVLGLCFTGCISDIESTDLYRLRRRVLQQLLLELVSCGKTQIWVPDRSTDSPKWTSLDSGDVQQIAEDTLVSLRMIIYSLPLYNSPFLQN